MVVLHTLGRIARCSRVGVNACTWFVSVSSTGLTRKRNFFVHTLSSIYRVGQKNIDFGMVEGEKHSR